jgi:subtilisin family serine protease
MHGKNVELDLELVPLRSRLEDGRRVFAPVGDAPMRAAFVATRAVAQAFVAPELAGARKSENSAAREEVASRVECAVFRDISGSLRIVYHELVVRFEPEATESRRSALLDRYGLRIRRQNPFLKDQFIVADEQHRYVAERTVELANELTETEEVAFAFPNFVSEFRRFAVPKPIKKQWHLRTVNARQAWETTVGRNVIVAVLDDGIDVDHPNLKRNIARRPDPSEPRDLLGRDFFLREDDPDHFNPRPKHFRAPFDDTPGNDIHGTPCAGVIASSGDADGVLGIAPEARILPVKVFHADQIATETRVANAIRYATRFADVISCSWGGPEFGDVENALEEADSGRDRLGTPIFCATGNENSRVSHPARSKFSIAVGASTDAELRASYSNHGPEVSIVAPSNGGAQGIFTTDVSTANRGYNMGFAQQGGVDGLHTNRFGGTSSATPLAAGVAALVLSAHPKLTRDAVRDLLQRTADKIGPPSSYDANGHSFDFGFGRINAQAAVAEALRLAGADKLSVAPTKRRSRKAAGKAAPKKRGTAKATGKSPGKGGGKKRIAGKSATKNRSAANSVRAPAGKGGKGSTSAAVPKKRR